MLMRLAAVLLCVLSALSTLSCSSTSEPASPSGDPTVQSMSPADGATDVGLVERVEIGFSEPMDPTTVSDTSLIVAARGLEGFVEYDESSNMLTFTPDTLYTPSAWFDVTVSGDIADLDGNNLGQDETFSFQTGPMDCAHMQDYFEPNDEVSSASSIEIGRVYRTLSGCDNDTDFFEFTLDETTRVLPFVEYKRANDELCYVHIRRNTGESYAYAGGYRNDGGTLGVNFTLLPGTYYVEVYGHGGYEDYVLYDISVTTSAPCNDDAYEDNDFFDEATPITPGVLEDLQGCYVDRDYFAVQADAGEVISVTVDVHTGGGSTRDVGIYGPSEDELTLYSGDDSLINVEATAAESGTHYVYVRFSGGGYIYNLDVSVTD